jgi:hypothetical protein
MPCRALTAPVKKFPKIQYKFVNACTYVVNIRDERDIAEIERQELTVRLPEIR